MNIRNLLYQNIFWRGLFFTSGFILNILIARHFDAAITGHIYYLFTIFSFFTLIGSLSIEAGIIYFGSKKEIPLTALAGFSVVWTGFIALMISGIYLFFMLWGKPIPFRIFQYALLFICGSVMLTFMTGLFYAQRNYITSNLAAICMNLLLIGILLNVDNDYWLNDQVFILIYFGSFLLLSICLWLLLLNKLPSPPFSFIKKKEFERLFKYALLVFYSNLIFFLLYKIDYWFVNRYCNPVDLGNYIQVSKLAQMFFILPGILAGALFPLIAGNHISRIEHVLKMVSRIVFFLYLICCGVLVLIGKWLFPFVFGESFAGMYQPFLYLIPGVLALSTLYTLTAYFSGINKVSVNLKGSLLALIFIVTGDALLIKKYGITAAAAVSSFGYIIYHVYVFFTFKKMHQTTLTGFYYFNMTDFERMKKLLWKNLPLYEKKQ